MKDNISQKAAQYFLFFLTYSVIGWVYEVFLEVVVYRWGYSDRGVLFGPYCPIYGVGALLFLLCLGKLLHAPVPKWVKVTKPVLLFLSCMVIATTIELAASYLLEALTGGWPWQTYLDYTVNFEGRIALSPSIRFGLGGLVFLYLVQPFLEKLVRKLSDRQLFCAAGILAAVFFLDVAVTVLF